ncbi:MAG: hypothetical protein ACREQ5_19690, partial [Candidatus Dormibacteria bacterium]
PDTAVVDQLLSDLAAGGAARTASARNRTRRELWFSATVEVVHRGRLGGARCSPNTVAAERWVRGESV